MSTFACIGWGSLLWDPRSLPMTAVFRADGPRLPIEFSRVSIDGRVTLVIDPRAEPMATWWCPLAVDSIEAAVAALGRRERIAPDRWAEWIAWQARASRSDRAAPRGGGAAEEGTRAVFERWLEARGIDFAVWTALPARTPEGRLAWPTTTALLDHLRGLEGEARERAEKYIRRTPRTIDSARRRRFEVELGWTASDARANPPTPGHEKEPL